MKILIIRNVKTTIFAHATGPFSNYENLSGELSAGRLARALPSV
jgi:hypothetical protein